MSVVSGWPEFRAFDDEPIRAVAPEFLAGSVGEAHDQRLELPDRVGAGVYRSAPGDHQHPQRFPRAASLAWLGVAVASDDHAGSADRVELIAFPAGIAVAPVGVIDLHHPLTDLLQMVGEPGAVATGPLDRPHPPATSTTRAA